MTRLLAMKTWLFLIPASLLLASGIACAQEPAPEAPAEGARTIRFYSLANDLPEFFYEPKKDEPIGIGGACGALSHPYPMPTKRVLEIYRKVMPPPNAPAGTKPLKEILATAKLPDGFSKVIVLLFPEGDSKTGTLRIAAFGDSYQLHPKGTVRVFNLAPSEISLKVGSVTNRFQPGQEAVMPWLGSTPNVVVFQTSVRSGEAWRILGTNELATRPNLRAFMFAYLAVPDIRSNVCFDSVPDKK